MCTHFLIVELGIEPRVCEQHTLPLSYSPSTIKQRNPACRGLCASDSCIKRAVVGLEGVLAKSPALTSRALCPMRPPLPPFRWDRPLVSAFMLKSCAILYPSVWKRMLAPWEGKLLGPLRSQNQARARESQRSQKGKDLLGLPHITPWQKFPTTTVASALT